MRAPRSEHGTVSVLLIGFALLVAALVAVVVDASAAYLQRQQLDTLADGAALHGADLGAAGEDAYDGLDRERLELTEPEVRAAVAAYLRDLGAHRAHPGLGYRVTLDPEGRTVSVEIRAPLDLPLTVPGSSRTTWVSASGSAVVGLDGP